MTKKALMLIDSDIVVGMEVSSQKVLLAQYREELTFLKKQHTDLMKKVDVVLERSAEEAKAMWARIETYLTSTGKLSGYDRSKQYMELDTEAGVLYVGDKEEAKSDDMPDFLKALLRALKDA